MEILQKEFAVLYKEIRTLSLDTFQSLVLELGDQNQEQLSKSLNNDFVQLPVL